MNVYSLGAEPELGSVFLSTWSLAIFAGKILLGALIFRGAGIFDSHPKLLLIQFYIFFAYFVLLASPSTELFAAVMASFLILLFFLHVFPSHRAGSSMRKNDRHLTALFLLYLLVAEQSLSGQSAPESLYDLPIFIGLFFLPIFQGLLSLFQNKREFTLFLIKKIHPAPVFFTTVLSLSHFLFLGMTGMAVGLKIPFFLILSLQIAAASGAFFYLRTYSRKVEIRRIKAYLKKRKYELNN